MRFSIKGRWKLMVGDCLQRMKDIPDNSIDSVVCDPPYGLSKEPDIVEVLQHWLAGDNYTHKGSGFMGKTWDSFVPGPAVWREALRVLKPGGYLIAFFGTRTYDLGTIAIRMAGFRVRDQLAWTYGSGFPKSQNVGDKIEATVRLGKAREEDVRKLRMGDDYAVSGRQGRKKFLSWQQDTPFKRAPELKLLTPEGIRYKGYGTALKPAWEPICLAQKPFKGTIAKNVLEHGVGALNIDACRVGKSGATTKINGTKNRKTGTILNAGLDGGDKVKIDAGRFPANLIHDGSAEVEAMFPRTKSGKPGVRRKAHSTNSMSGTLAMTGKTEAGVGDEGSAARFFYVAKPSKSERNAATKNDHPTVKPVALMEHLVQMVTPAGGVVLDPFFGSGTTGVAALNKGFRVIGCEQSKDYAKIASARLRSAKVKKGKIHDRREAKPRRNVK